MRARRANAAGRAGDDTNFIFKLTHESLPGANIFAEQVQKSQKKPRPTDISAGLEIIGVFSARLFSCAALQRLIGLRRMRGAIGAAIFGARTAEMEIRRARIANRPFAGMFGQMQHTGAFFRAQNRLRHHLVFDVIELIGAKPRAARQRGR